MSYIGRVEIQAVKDGDYVEVLECNLRANKAHRNSGYAGNTMLEELGSHELVRDILEGRTDGIHNIAGTYHEDWSQDYWGEWDCDFRIETSRVKLVGRI